MLLFSRKDQEMKIFPYFLIFLLTQVTSNNLMGMQGPPDDEFENKGKTHVRVLTSEQVRDYFQQGVRVYRAILNKQLPLQLYNVAYKCFLQAARYDHAVALFNAGVFNEYGLGTEKDLKTAVAFYKRARACGYKNDDEIAFSLELVKSKMENNVFY